MQYDILDIYKDRTINLERLFYKDDMKISYLQPFTVTLKQLILDTGFLKKVPEEYFDFYTVTENTLEKISQSLYQDSDSWWIIGVINNINNIFTFNLTNQQIIETAKHLYETEGKYHLNVYMDLLLEYNNNNKKIKYIKKNNLNDFYRIIFEYLDTKNA